MKLEMIAAMSQNRVIGKDNTLPWRMPTDLKHFKDTTLNTTIICGRKTFESIGKPLPNRETIILSRDPNYKVEGCATYTDLEKALWENATKDRVVCIGGAEIYKLALPYAKKIHLTEIQAIVDGDAYFPLLDSTWKMTSNTEPLQGPKDQFPAIYYTYEKY